MRISAGDAEEGSRTWIARRPLLRRTRGPIRIVLNQVFRRPEIRFWRCANERAQAQAVARDVEHLLATGTSPEEICVLIEDPVAKGGPVAAAMEERGIPFHLSGPAALFQRPEVRDAIAWLRVLADPGDSAAAARALTRPPIELRSADLARLTTIARRRKLDMVSACEAALESPQITPEARERIQSFLKLYGAASAAMEERRADVFVRRLIERVGLRRQRLFAAQPEVAERLLGPLAAGRAGLGLGAARAARLDPRLRPLPERRRRGRGRAGRRRGAALAGRRCSASTGRPPRGASSTASSCSGSRTAAAVERIGRPARAGIVLSRVERRDGERAGAAPFYEQALAATERRGGGARRGALRPRRGPARDLPQAARGGARGVLEGGPGALGAAARHGGRRQPGDRPLPGAAEARGARPAARATRRPPEAVEAVNGLLRQVATPEQQTELDASPLDSYLLDSERDRDSRRRLIAARHEPSLEAFLPRRGDGGLSLSASDLDLYLTCPLKYKFARVFGIPQEPTINQRFGILIHNVLERFHRDEPEPGEDGLRRLMGLLEAGWRRSGFGTSDDELQYRDRAREAMRLYWERERESEGEPVWLERKFDFQIGPHHVRGRVDRVDRLPDGSHELIDYKTGERKSEAQLESDLQLALYRLAAREAWDLEAVDRQLLLRARRRQGRGADQARRRRAGRAHRAPGRRGRARPGLRAAALAEGLQLVRLPADLPGRRELSPAGGPICPAGAGSAGSRGRSCRPRAARFPRRRAARPARPRSARPAP